jgi:hypothetical protein
MTLLLEVSGGFHPATLEASYPLALPIRRSIDGKERLPLAAAPPALATVCPIDEQCGEAPDRRVTASGPSDR